MKKNLIVLLVLIFAVSNIHAQQVISFSFTANHTCEYAELDSVLIENLTHGGDTVLYWNDTVLTLNVSYIDIISAGQPGFYVSQNYPNPFETKTEIDIFVPLKDDFTINVFDLTGRQVALYNNLLDMGMHNFTFYAGSSKTYILTVMSGQHLQHIKMLQFGQSGSMTPQIEYNGTVPEENTEDPVLRQKSAKTYFPYEIGDELKFTVFVSGDFLEITDSPTVSEEYFFDIANEVPGGTLELTGVDEACEYDTNLIFEATQIDGVTYEWTVPGDWTIVSGENTHSITVDAGAESGEITVKAVNSCGEGDVSSLLIITHKKPLVDSPDDVIACDIYELPELTNGSYFAGPNGEGAELSAGAEITVSQTIYVYAYDVNCPAEESFEITIYESPMPTAGSNSPVCEDENIELAVDTGFSWEWTGSEGFSSTEQNPVILQATILNAGEYTVVVTDEYGCTGTSSTDVTVNENPVPIAVNNSPVCEDENIEFTVDTGISWEWTGPGDFASTEQNPVIELSVLSHEGEYTVVVTDTNGCTGTSSTDVTVNENPVPTAVSNSPVCEDENIEFTVDTGISWEWTGPGDFSSTEQNPGILSATILNTGEYTVVVTDANGCTVTSSTDVTVNENPVPTVVSNSPVCEDENIEFTVDVGFSWEWTGSEGFSSTEQNPVILQATILNAGEYTVVVTDENGCMGTSSTDVTVNINPIPTAGSNSPVCAGEDIEFTVDIGISWEWTGPGDFASTLQNPGILSAITLNMGVYTVVVADANGCTGTSLTDVTVNTVPDASTTGIHIPDQYQIEWNWNPVTNMDGYKYNTENNYEEATDIGVNTTFLQTNLDCGELQTLYVWAYNNHCGQAEVLILEKNTIYCPFEICGDHLEYMGYWYPTVQIGEQCWIAENLRYLPSVHEEGTSSNTEPHYYVYGYNGNVVAEAKATENYEIYGVLYNWSAAMTACPAGWKLPTDDDWKTLELELGMSTFQADNSGFRGTNEGSKLAGNSFLWQSGDLISDPEFNTSGFVSIPGGFYLGYDSFYEKGNNSISWAATDEDEESAWYRDLDYRESQIHRNFYIKDSGFSVRCVME